MLRTVILPRRPPLVRPLHTTVSRCYPRQRPISALKLEESKEFDLDEMQDFEMDDIPQVGHEILMREREYVHYMRLIEIEGPILESLQKPYRPVDQPIRIRTITYGGEPHPAMAKGVLVAPVARLGLEDWRAIHRFKHLAGPRWSIEPPTDSGITPEQHAEEGGEGYIKISCEDFPMQTMNVKMCSDMLDRMIERVREMSTDGPRAQEGDMLVRLPLDVRHLVKRARKTGRHVHAKKDHFPLEWIPEEMRERARLEGAAR